MEQFMIDFCKEQGLAYIEECPPWPGDHPPVVVGSGGGVRQTGGWYCSSLIAYPDGNGGFRIPQEKTVGYPLTRFSGFRAAGKHYRDLTQLRHDRGDHIYLSRDIYGREIFYLCKSFPCFDEFDALYDDRLYRWYFIREEGRLTRIYYCDGDDTVSVTEDVQNLEDWCLETMLEVGYFPEVKGDDRCE